MRKTCRIAVTVLLVLLIAALIPSVCGVAAEAAGQRLGFAPTDPTPDLHAWYLAEGPPLTVALL